MRLTLVLHDRGQTPIVRTPRALSGGRAATGCARSRTSQMKPAISSWARASQRLPFSAVAAVASPVTPDCESALQCGMYESGPSLQSIHMNSVCGGISLTAFSICTSPGSIAR